MRIEISPHDLSGLVTLLDEDPDAINELIENVESVRPHGSYSTFMENLLDSTTKMSRRKVNWIMDKLTWLYYNSIDEADQPIVLDDYIRSVQDALPPEMSEKQVNLARVILESLFKVQGGFGLTLKANDLLTEHQRNFSRVRIISDIRPLYDTDTIKEKPLAAVIAHVLKIQYSDAGQSMNFYIGLDTDELYEIKACVDRAIDKTASLKSIISKSGISYVESEKEE